MVQQLLNDLYLTERSLIYFLHTQTFTLLSLYSGRFEDVAGPVGGTQLTLSPAAAIGPPAANSQWEASTMTESSDVVKGTWAHAEVDQSDREKCWRRLRIGCGRTEVARGHSSWRSAGKKRLKRRSARRWDVRQRVQVRARAVSAHYYWLISDWRTESSTNKQTVNTVNSSGDKWRVRCLFVNVIIGKQTNWFDIKEVNRCFYLSTVSLL